MHTWDPAAKHHTRPVAVYGNIDRACTLGTLWLSIPYGRSTTRREGVGDCRSRNFKDNFERGNFTSNNERFVKPKRKKFGNEILNDKMKQLNRFLVKKTRKENKISANSPPQLIRHCTLAIHLTLLIFCNIINPQCPRALLPVSYLQFHGITYPLVLVLYVSLLREFGTP